MCETLILVPNFRKKSLEKHSFHVPYMAERFLCTNRMKVMLHVSEMLFSFFSHIAVVQHTTALICRLTEYLSELSCRGRHHHKN